MECESYLNKALKKTMPPLEHKLSWGTMAGGRISFPHFARWERFLTPEKRCQKRCQSNCNPQPTSARSYVTRLQLKDPEDTGGVHTTWPENGDRRMALV